MVQTWGLLVTFWSIGVCQKTVFPFSHVFLGDSRRELQHRCKLPGLFAVMSPYLHEKSEQHRIPMEHPKKGQPPYTQSYPHTHSWNSSEHVNAKIRQVREEENRQTLRVLFLFTTKSIHDDEQIMLHFRDNTIDQTGEGVSYSPKHWKLKMQLYLWWRDFLITVFIVHSVLIFFNSFVTCKTTR